jgi:integrase
MAPRQRKPSNRALPPNLRERGGYFSWRNPEDGVEYGLGRDKRSAIAQAVAANMKIAGESPRPTLVDRLSGDESRTWGKWCTEFETLLAERDSADNTCRTRRSQMNRMRQSFNADMPAAAIDTMAIAAVLKAIKEEGKARTAQAFRTLLIDCFDRMVAQGWRKDNPARVTDVVTVKVKRARLPFDVFQKLYEATSVIWLRNAMDLALVTGQDRDSCRNAKFADFREGGWWNERSKTGARIFLPTELRLAATGKSLEDVLRQCRGTGILSHHLIHQTQRGRGSRLGKAMHKDMITRGFTLELAKLGLDWGGKKPPTFHEIRSLSSRLYKAQGDVNPQELLGHKDPRTTAIYTDGRGEWVKVGIRK